MPFLPPPLPLFLSHSVFFLHYIWFHSWIPFMPSKETHTFSASVSACASRSDERMSRMEFMQDWTSFWKIRPFIVNRNACRTELLEQKKVFGFFFFLHLRLHHLLLFDMLEILVLARHCRCHFLFCMYMCALYESSARFRLHNLYSCIFVVAVLLTTAPKWWHDTPWHPHLAGVAASIEHVYIRTLRTDHGQTEGQQSSAKWKLIAYWLVPFSVSDFVISQKKMDKKYVFTKFCVCMCACVYVCTQRPFETMDRRNVIQTIAVDVGVSNTCKVEKELYIEIISSLGDEFRRSIYSAGE